MTVVQVLPGLDGGGVERGTLEVAQALVENGYRSIVISGGGRLVPRLTAKGSEHVQWPIGEKSLWTLQLVRRLRRYLEEQGVDILHARSRLPAWIAYLAWRKMDPATRPRFVTTVHGLYSVNSYSAIMTKGERVIAVSDTAREYIEKNYPFTDPSRIVTIYRGVDTTIFPSGYKPPDSWMQRWYEEHPFLLDRLVLTLPGRITRLKGHADFIELISRLVQAGLNVHGLIVGGEDPRRKRYAEELHQLIKTRGLQERITFTGHRMDVRDIYAVSNLVLSLSSKPESFGRTVLEALSMGVPVIGYSHGGVGEILGSCFAQGKVEAGNTAQLFDEVLAMLQSPVELEPCLSYPQEGMVSKTLKLYASF